MKFLCSNCKAKYQIADEKVAGRTLRMTCRRCREEIVIHGDGGSASGYPPSGAGHPGAPPPAPSPLGADFQMQVASHARAQAPVAPILDEWHVGINDVPVGPMRREEVARKLAAGAIHAESLAWREGLDDWLPIRQIPELAVLLQSMPGIGLPPPALPQQAFAAQQFAPPPPPPAYAVAVPPPAAYAVAVPPPAAYAARPAPPPAAYASPSPLPPPGYAQAPAMQPAQRAEMAPIGGRAGAAAGYGVEEWAPVGEPAPAQSASQVALNQLLEAGAAQRRMTVSAPVMFALASGFALLMSALAIVGARILVANQTAAAPAPAAAAAAAPSAQPVAPVAQARAPEAPEPSGAAPALEDPNAQAQARASAALRGAAGPKAGAPKTGKKELTEDQKAMLARMGGSDSAQVASLKTATNTAQGPAVRGSGGLTSEQFSKVVLKGRESLQRCYETALRGSGSTDTVRMDVEIMVSPNGNVTSVKTSGQGLPGMGQCIERTVRMWRFPNAAEASGTHFPLLFQPGS